MVNVDMDTSKKHEEVGENMLFIDKDAVLQASMFCSVFNAICPIMFIFEADYLLLFIGF